MKNTGKSAVIQQNERKKMTKEQLRAQLKKMYERDKELVTGIFRNYENSQSQGLMGVVRFTYKIYPWDQVEKYEFVDGEKYTIPRGVARHINNNCYYYKYANLTDPSGQSSSVQQGISDGRMQSHQDNRMQTRTKVHRFAFQSLEFMDEDLDMYPSNIIEVGSYDSKLS